MQKLAGREWLLIVLSNHHLVKQDSRDVRKAMLTNPTLIHQVLLF